MESIEDKFIMLKPDRVKRQKKERSESQVARDKEKMAKLREIKRVNAYERAQMKKEEHDKVQPLQ